jgi:hypothetical protein
MNSSSDKADEYLDMYYACGLYCRREEGQKVPYAPSWKMCLITWIKWVEEKMKLDAHKF